MSATADPAPPATTTASSPLSAPSVTPSPPSPPSHTPSPPSPSPTPLSAPSLPAGKRPVPPLTRQQWATMLGTGLFFQACASGRWSFACGAWLCLFPLAVLARTAPWSRALPAIFAVVWGGRFVAWFGAVPGDAGGAALAAAQAAVLTTAAIFAYRHVMRELPRAGSFALPLAVVAGEGVAVSFGIAGLSSWPLWTTQVSDVPLWSFVDVLTPWGISFCVAWAQGVMAGWGESWLAEDPYDQATRERGVRQSAALCFWLVGVVVHVGGFFRTAPDASLMSMPSSSSSSSPAVVAAGLLALLLVSATVVRVRRRTSLA